MSKKRPGTAAPRQVVSLEQLRGLATRLGARKTATVQANRQAAHRQFRRALITHGCAVDHDDPIKIEGADVINLIKIIASERPEIVSLEEDERICAVRIKGLKRRGEISTLHFLHEQTYNREIIEHLIARLRVL
jgi:hypothetical protein